MKRHWQHIAINKDVILYAESFNGLTDARVRFLQWLYTKNRPVGRSVVVREFLQREILDYHALEDARNLLETLAINGYLLRGRHRAPPRTGISHFLQGRSPPNHPSKDGWAFTQYRLSMKSKRLLAKHGSNSSTRDSTH